VGITAQDQDRIWGEFELVDSSRSKQFPGTGLGLALVKRIVERPGGSVDVTSEPGVGSTFGLTVPDAVPSPGGDT
jgi:signal transduction histidine kinase